MDIIFYAFLLISITAWQRFNLNYSLTKIQFTIFTISQEVTKKMYEDKPLAEIFLFYSLKKIQFKIFTISPEVTKKMYEDKPLAGIFLFC